MAHEVREILNDVIGGVVDGAPDVPQHWVLLHPIAAAAADLLVGEDHSCRQCDTNDCGRAQKIERYVARRAARKPSLLAELRRSVPRAAGGC